MMLKATNQYTQSGTKFCLKKVDHIVTAEMLEQAATYFMSENNETPSARQVQDTLLNMLYDEGKSWFNVRFHDNYQVTYEATQICRQLFPSFY